MPQHRRLTYKAMQPNYLRYIIFCLLVLSLPTGYARLHGTDGAVGGPSWLQRWRSKQSQNTCKVSEHVSGPKQKTAIFDQLSILESYRCIEHMVTTYGYKFIPGWDATSGLNSSMPITDPEPTINYIYMVELLPHPKAAAIAYLDGITDTPPFRFARVIVIRGALEYRDVMEYKVGPLGSDVDLTSEPLTKPGEIPYTMSPFDSLQYVWAEEAVFRGVAGLNDVFLNITGGKYGLTDASEGSAVADSNAISWDVALNWLSNDTNGRIGHVVYYFMPGYGGDAYYLHPLPISHKLNWTAANPQDWYTFSFEFCHQYFRTADDLLAAFNAGTLRLCSAPEWSRDDLNINWARVDNLEDYVPPRPGSETPSPRQFTPQSPRYKLHKSPETSGTHFSWMGWTGHVAVHPFSGVQFFDLRFKGERIMYELSLQDQMVQYSGYGHQGQTLFSDSFYNLGSSTFSLMPGMDCPEDADYASIVVPDFVGRPQERRQAVCFHEVDPGTSNWRHFYLETEDNTIYPRLAGTRDTHFVVRTVATIGNYDYIYEVHFHLDGEVDVKVVMAGYMEASFNDPAGATWRNEFFAPRVHKYVRANLHTHFSHWKVDLDVKGRQNHVVKQAVKVGTYEDIGLETPGWAVGESFPLQYIESTPFHHEQGYQLHFHEPVSMQVRSTSTDQWGNEASYAIVHGATSMELLPASHPLTRAMSWCKYHLAFTKHKDQEWISHDMRYAYSNLKRYRYTLDDYMQPPEALDGEDVVAWVSLTGQHIPRTEDVPLIANKAMHFKISPWNYFPSLQSLEVPTQNDFPTCAPPVGQAYNYSWEAEPFILPQVPMAT